MLTLFASPKPFRGHIGTIQRNALGSWTRLVPRPEIILFGEEDGTAAAAADFGAAYVPDIERNEYGTPLLSSLFERAQQLSHRELLCYLNADILLIRNFAQAIDRLANWKRAFLLVGQRWDVDCESDIDFEPEWEERLVKLVADRGTLHPPTGIDYFVFQRGCWDSLPPFAVGRVGYDNWLIFEARCRGQAVVDGTAAITAIHQNHDYAHLPGGPSSRDTSPEARCNFALAGGPDHMYTIQDATWLLTPFGPKPAQTRRHLQRRLRRWVEQHSSLWPKLVRFRDLLLSHG